MLKIYQGSYPLVKESISQLATKNSMEIQYCKKFLPAGFFSKPKVYYTLYNDSDFKQFDVSITKGKSIYCIIIEDISKTSAFYKRFKKDIILVEKPRPTINLVDELYKDLHVLNIIEEKDRLSFLYKVYYDRKHRQYRKAAGYCINEVLTGKIPVKNIFQIFVLTI